VLSAMWILFSDKLLLTNPNTTIYISTAKGWFYTIIVGVFIYFTLTREINLIKKAESATEELQLLLKSSLDSQRDTILLSIDKNYNYLYFNKALVDVTKYAYGVDVKLGDNALEIMPLSDRAAAKQNFDKALSGESYMDIRIYGDKNKAYYESFSNPIINESGKIIGATVLARNVTDRIKAEEKLKELDKLKDDFLSITTHELKTPLTPIKSQSQLLLNGDYGPLNAEQRHSILMIARNEENLNRLISDLTDISKIKSNKLKLIFEKVKPNEIINSIIKDVANLTEEKNINISFLPVANDLEIIADKLRLTQIVSNLINNAIKFTPENGHINIDAKNIDNNVIITIKDTGIGLSLENINKLFMPFFQVQSDLNRQYRGTGLGLAITKGIVEAHGGKIWAESPGEGQGSSFIFTLPIK
jgi:PAS domain S-box-containing protein